MNIVEAKFLDDHSDDFYGLWEVHGYLNDNLGIVDIVDMISFIENIINQEYLSVFFENDIKGSASPLDRHSAQEKIRDRSNWLPPEANSSRKICYVCESSKGESVRSNLFPNI